MELAVSFPSEELGTDLNKIKDFVQGVEQLGYTQIHAGEHIIGADPERFPEHPFTINSVFHEPLILMTYLAAISQHLLLVPAVLILPMRQTVLAAKMAAEVDIFSGGRLRLGLGIGSNQYEYDIMGKDFHTRGKRFDEQIELMRALWTNRVVTFEGQNDSVIAGGLNPMPIQQPIPIWIGGGGVDVAMKRIARLADGWIVTGRLEGGAGPAIEKFKGYVKEYGRDISKIAITARGNAGATPDEQRKSYQEWESLGATVVVVATGKGEPAQMLDNLRRYKEAVS